MTKDVNDVEVDDVEVDDVEVNDVEVDDVEVDDAMPLAAAALTLEGMVGSFGTIIDAEAAPLSELIRNLEVAAEYDLSLKPFVDELKDASAAVQQTQSTLDTVKKVLLNIAPVFLIFGWVDFFKSVRALYQAENRHYELWMNVLVNFVSAAGLTIAFALVMAGVAGFVYAAPYVIAGILGLAAARGLYYTAKHFAYAIAAAWKGEEWKGEEWKAHAWNGVKAFFSMAISTLGIALNVLLISSQTLADLAGKIGDMILEGSVNVLEILGTPVVAVAAAWLSAIGVMLMAATVKINRQSFDTLSRLFRGKGYESIEPSFESVAKKDINSILEACRHPGSSWVNFGLAITAPITVPAYAIAAAVYTVVIRPLALLTGTWLYLIAKCFPAKKAEIASLSIESLNSEWEELKIEIETQKEKKGSKKIAESSDKDPLAAKALASKETDQIDFLEKVEKAFEIRSQKTQGTLQTIRDIKQAMLPSKRNNCFQSFWKPEGNDIAVLARKAEALEQKYAALESSPHYTPA